MPKPLIVIACLIIVACSAMKVLSQEEQSGMIKSANGVLVVWNEPGNYFTIEIKGKEIVPAKQPKLFQVDGKFFQIQTTEKKQFVKNGKTSDDKAVLAAHRDWERDYAADLFKNDLKAESEWVKLPSGQDALAWSYKMPKVMGTKVKKQMFLTVVKRDHVFVVSSALENDGDEKDINALLLQTLLTLKSTDKPLNLQKASEQIKNAN